MKVLPFKIPKPHSDTIVFQEDKGNYFYDKYHQHEEIQISHIVEGEGTLVVGETVNNYKKGSIIVIGSNLPHVFKSSPNTDSQSIMHSLFFTRNSFGKEFFNIEELKPLQSFFKRADTGFIATSHISKLHQLFYQLESSSKFERFMLLMKTLRLLSRSQFSILSNFTNDRKFSDDEGKRISAVMEFTINNYRNSISLSQIAEVATMSKNAFCKYFKRRTNKTYFQFLNEMRIETVCKEMDENRELTIAEIAENCGFNNISNFNRQFKSVKKQNPTTFKKSSL